MDAARLNRATSLNRLDYSGNRFGSGLNWMFPRPQRQVVRYHINKNESEHQDHNDLDSPISMRALPEVVARMQVISRLGSFALHVVPLIVHISSINAFTNKSDAIEHLPCSIASAYDSNGSKPGKMASDAVDQLLADGFVAGHSDADFHFAHVLAGLFDVDRHRVALGILGGYAAVHTRAVADNVQKFQIVGSF